MALLCLLTTGLAKAQQQSKAINYQGIARDASGEVISDESIDLQLSILLGASDTAPSYTEDHTVTTDASGVFAVRIGNGTPILGNFDTLDFNGLAPFLRTSLNGSVIGVTEMHAVPFARTAEFAEFAEMATDMNLSDLNNVSAAAPASGQILKFDGTNWVSDTDAGTEYTAGDGITITGDAITAQLGSSISNSEILNNEITGQKLAPMGATPDQVLSYDGASWGPSSIPSQSLAINDLNDVAADAPAVGEVLKWNGSAWESEADDNTEYTAGDGITITGDAITAQLGSTISNSEILNNEITAEKLAPMGATANQVLSYNGTSWEPSTPPAPSLAINDLTDVTAGSPITGEVLKWDGTVWTYGTDEGGQWSDATDGISYTSGSVGMGTSEPEDGTVAHFSGDVLIQTNMGELNLGFPDNGNRWAFATQGNGANLIFRSKASGSNTETTRMRLDQDGQLGIGSANGSPTARLHIFQNGQALDSGLRFTDGTANEDWNITHGYSFRFHYGNDFKAAISPTTGAYIMASDRSLKSNIVGLNNVTERLQLLYPVSYTYKSDKTQTKTIGLVAQELKEVFPEFVHYSEADGLYAVDYAGLSVVAIKALQEQQNKIASLEERLEALEKK